MSWQAYVDQNLVGTGQITKGAIFSLDGAGAWAATSGFNVTPQEMKTIASGFSSPDQFFGTGVHIAGEKYMTIKAEGRSLYGKKGKDGVIIVQTKQAILVGYHNDTIASPNAANIVEKLADYLISVGY